LLYHRLIEMTTRIKGIATNACGDAFRRRRN